MYTRILVATGGSPWSEAALAHAVALAAHTGGTLRILTVLTVPAAATMPDMVGGSDVLMDAIELQGREFLAEAAVQVASAGVPCETVYAWGNIPETILRTAAQSQSDLIVMGSRGASGWKRLMLGSNVNAVTAKASQPVLVVKRPRVPILGKSCWRRVLVATGGSPWSHAAVDHALQLAQAQQLELCVLHVERDRPLRGHDPAPSEGKDLLTQVEARAAMAGIVYEGVLASGDVTRAILQTAADKACDAMILGARGMTGWKRLKVGNIANTVAAKAPVPVLLVKRFFHA